MNDKSREQIELLQEKKEQIELMLEWHKELSSMNRDLVDALVLAWENAAPEAEGDAKREFKRLQKKYTFEEITHAMSAAADTYLKVDANGREFEAGRALSMVSRICYCQKQAQTDPNIKQLYYIRANMARRGFYFTPWVLMRDLKEAIQNGLTVDELSEIADNSRNITAFRQTVGERTRKDSPTPGEQE